MKYKLLLLEDVVNLGRKGEIVNVNPGFARNFLIPKMHGVVATKSALKMQEQLQKDRADQGKQDKQEAEKLATEINEKTFSITTKVDVEGNMYGSVKPQDIAGILAKAGYEFERKQIQIPHTIKKIGSVNIEISLKEGVKTSFLLEIKPDREIKKKKNLETQVKEMSDEASPSDKSDEATKQESASE